MPPEGLAIILESNNMTLNTDKTIWKVFMTKKSSRGKTEKDFICESVKAMIVSYYKKNTEGWLWSPRPIYLDDLAI